MPVLVLILVNLSLHTHLTHRPYDPDATHSAAEHGMCAAHGRMPPARLVHRAAVSKKVEAKAKVDAIGRRCRGWRGGGRAAGVHVNVSIVGWMGWEAWRALRIGIEVAVRVRVFPAGRREAAGDGAEGRKLREAASNRVSMAEW